MSSLSRQQVDFIKDRISEAPRRFGKSKPKSVVKLARREELKRRDAAGARAFDAVVAGRPLKPGKAVAGG